MGRSPAHHDSGHRGAVMKGIDDFKFTSRAVNQQLNLSMLLQGIYRTGNNDKLQSLQVT